MIPAMKLNTRPVISSQPPHSTVTARRGSVRGARRVRHNSTESSTSAAGSSHDAPAPISEPNRRGIPVCPPPPPGPPPAPPPGPDRAVDPRRPPPAAGTPADAAGLVAGQPAEAVVAEHELQHAVV